MKKVLLITISCSLALTIVSCTSKKRENVFAQGLGENLELISDFDGKRFKLKTLKAIDGAGPSVGATSENTKIDSNVSGTKYFPLVNYETNADLLRQSPLRGKPESDDYEIVYKLTNSYLTVYKVAAEKFIPINEKTYAETEADGRLAVPIIGYPVKEYVNVESIRNDKDENTNKLTEIKAVEKSKAKYFRFDRNAGILFKEIAKSLLLPATLFTGEWYYTETVVATALEKQIELGFTLNLDQNQETSNRVKFILNEDLLKVVSLNLDARLDANDQVNLPNVMTAPIAWIAFKKSMNGQDMGLNEELNTSLHWSKRPYLFVDLDKSTTLKNEGDSAKIVEFEVTDDYLSFTLQQSKKNRRLRYSFMRVTDRKYTPKVYHEKDVKKFGFFSTLKSTIMNYEIRRKEDIYKNNFLNRFNPNLINKESGKQEIVFHFTDTSPKCSAQEIADKICLREATKIAIDNWDRAFKMAGTNLRIRLDDSKDVRLGDLRYNSINLIDSLMSANLSGFGPSVADPYTGEIISATTNMHITEIRTLLIEEIRNYIRHQTGQLKDDYYFNNDEIKALSGDGIRSLRDANSLSHSFDPMKNSIVVTGSLVPQYAQIELSMPEPAGNKIVKKNIEFKNNFKNYGREFDLGLSSGNIHAEIKEKCPEVDDYISNLIQQNQDKVVKIFHNDNELEILNKCSKKMVINKMLGTLVHELGHNFGLRHNFRASTDVANFFPTEGAQQQVRSSSVMEYPSFNDDRLTTPGAYDIAAIRFGYADAIAEINNEQGGVIQVVKELKLDVKKSIDENLAKNPELKPNKYLYCTDEDTDITKEDPLCRRHDSGLTPKEIVEDLIKSYNSSSALDNHRYDNIRLPSFQSLVLYRLMRYYLPMKGIYDEWRALVASHLGLQNKYLETYSTEEYRAKLEEMDEIQDENGRYKFKEYHQAADLIFKFLKDLASLPVKYCVVEKHPKTDNSIELIELESLRAKIGFLKTVKIRSCSDPVIIANLDKMGFKFLKETGQFFNNIKFETSTDSTRESLDVIGSLYDRTLAAGFIGFRDSQSVLLKHSAFNPGLMDEPHYREEWGQMLSSRILQGLDVEVLLEDLKKKIPGRDLKSDLQKSLLKFSRESELLKSQWDAFVNGIQVPNKSAITMQRQSQHSGFLTANPQIVDKAIAKAKISTNTFFVVFDDKALFPIALINKFNQLLLNSSLTEQEIDSSLIAEFEKLAPLLPTAQEKQNKMTMAEVNLLIQSLQNKIGQESDEEKKKNLSANFGFMTAIFEKISNALIQQNVEKILPLLPSEVQEKLKANTELNQEEKNIFQATIQKILGPMDAVAASVSAKAPFPYFREGYLQLLEQFKQQIEKKNAEQKILVEEYKKNKEELDAQLDLILNIMSKSERI